jgi:thiol-disulfide isomerase/thioredoxin
MLKQQAGIIKRLDVMELLSHDGISVERNNAGDPHEGLPIGSPFPDFELPDVYGEQISLQQLLSEKRPIVFFFVSPACNPCRALVPELEEWQRTLGEKVSFVLVSSGKAKDNTERFGGETPKTILLQNKEEVAYLVNAQWTPTALFVGAEGRILSRLAAGDVAIRELMEKVVDEDLKREFLFISNGNGDGPPLKIGEDIPKFSLPDLHGNEFNSSDLRGARTLVTFWSLTCPHCIAMIEDFKQWEAQNGENTTKLLIFSDGDPDEHRKFDLVSPILIDGDNKVFAKFETGGATPAAVLVDENGKIISETAKGSAKIWALLGKRKSNL